MAGNSAIEKAKAEYGAVPKGLAAMYRREKAADLIASGIRYTQIVTMLIDQCGIHKRQAERDIKEAYGLLHELNAEKLEDKIAKMSRRLERRAMRAEGAGDFAAATAADSLNAKINGMFAPTKLEHSGSLGGVIVVPAREGTVEDWVEKYSKERGAEE